MDRVTDATPGWRELWVLLCVAFAVRGAFFFDSVVGWDETTFILMGQSVLDGFVPYRDYWDLKPPLVYGLFALIDLLSLHTIVGVRIVGAVLVALTGLAVFALARRFARRNVALAAAIISVVLASSLSGGPATMSEIVAMPFWMAGLVPLSMPLPSRGAGSVALGGVLLSIATLTRLNLAFAVVATALALLYLVARYDGGREARRVLLWLAVGGCAPLVLTALYFALRSDLASLWMATVEAPLLYARNQLSGVQVLGGFARRALRSPLVPVVCVVGFGAAVWSASLARQMGYAAKAALVLCLATLLGAGYSIVSGGNAYSHYVLQIIPPAAVPIAACVDRLEQLAPRLAVAATAAFVVLCTALGLVPTARKVPELAARAREHGTLFSDEGYRLTDYLVSHLQDGDSLLLMDRHIAYWKTRKWPPTKILHPSNINRAYLLPAIGGVPSSPEALMQQILDTEPTVIVAPDDVRYLDKGGPVDAELRRALDEHYGLEATIDTMKVFRRVGS